MSRDYKYLVQVSLISLWGTQGQGTLSVRRDSLPPQRHKSLPLVPSISIWGDWGKGSYYLLGGGNYLGRKAGEEAVDKVFVDLRGP